MKNAENCWQIPAVCTDTGRFTRERSHTSVHTVTSKLHFTLLIIKIIITFFLVWRITWPTWKIPNCYLILCYCRRFIQRYNMKQHIKTHRMDPEDIKSSSSINIDLTPKVETMNHLKLPLPNFHPDNGMNMTHWNITTLVPMNQL